MRRMCVILCFLFSAVVSPFAHADESVVVTATRTPQPIERTGESVSVITGEQLDQQPDNLL